MFFDEVFDFLVFFIESVFKFLLALLEPLLVLLGHCTFLVVEVLELLEGVVSGLLGLNQLLVEGSVLFLEVADLEFVGQFDLIVFLLLIFKVICQSLPILVVLLFLLFSLVHEFLFHLIYFNLGFFLANDRLSV